MKFIYVAGPLRGKTLWGRMNNVRHAEEVTLFLLKKGMAVHCPHTQCQNYDGERDEDSCIQADLEIISRCDGIFFMNGWRDSRGSAVEHEFAEQKGIRIFYESDKKLSPHENSEALSKWAKE